MKGTIAVIGGSQEAAMKKLANTMGYTLLFDDAKRARQRKYQSMVENADSIVVMTGACSHKAMWLVKSLAKIEDKPISYARGGYGITNALYLGMKEIEKNNKNKRSFKQSKNTKLEAIKKAEITIITKSFVFGQTTEGEHVLLDSKNCKFPAIKGSVVEGTIDERVMIVERFYPMGESLKRLVEGS